MNNSDPTKPPLSHPYDWGCHLIRHGQYEEGLGFLLELEDFSPAKGIAETVARMALEMRHLDYAYIAAWISGNQDLQSRIEHLASNGHKLHIEDLKIHVSQGRDAVRLYYSAVLLPRGHDILFHQNH